MHTCKRNVTMQGDVLFVGDIVVCMRDRRAGIDPVC
jgi:hypothetical protein